VIKISEVEFFTLEEPGYEPENDQPENTNYRSIISQDKFIPG